MMKKRTKKKETAKSVSKNNKKAVKKKNRAKKIILNLILIGVILGIIAVCAFFGYIVTNAPKFDPNNLKFTQMSEMYDADGNIIAKLGNENRTEITYDKLPEVLIDAIIATEDSRFFEHNGFDLPRFMKASIRKRCRWCIYLDNANCKKQLHFNYLNRD